MAFLSAKKKLDVLKQAVELQTIFRTHLLSDTGVYHGSDTGAVAASSTSRIRSAKLAAILNANTEYAAEGWYINTKAILVSMGETVS